MADGEVDFSNQGIFTDANMLDNDSLDTFFDDIFKDTHACTHTHTCNPPGPDSSHTHTCYHVHTKIVRTDDDETPTHIKGKKRPLGNRQAVRKYREEKKARTASLGDEVARLTTLNQQLMKRIQSQAGLEAELARLKCLLVDIRWKIEGEIGTFPYQKPPPLNLTGGYGMNPCNMQCGGCLHPQVDGENDSIHNHNDCEFENLPCMGNQHSLLNEFPGCATDNDIVMLGGQTKRIGSRAVVTK